MKQQFLNLSQVADNMKAFSKALLVCDSSYPYLNIKDRIEQLDIPMVKFSDFTSNPLYEDVCKGVDLFNSQKCDVIIAVGGGSTIDVAKCIKLFCKLSKDKLYIEQDFQDSGISLIAIPTTAGTGSESTRYAVIYYGGKKQSITHDSIVPDIAILEPAVLKTLPLYQKKCTMLDALCQGIESWWSVNSTPQSKEYSKSAVETIMKRWREYIFDNTDIAAKEIMQASNLAGRAICITQTTAPHAFSYKITSMYGLPHGHAVAVGLPRIWTYMVAHMDRCIDKRGTDYLNRTFMDIAAAMGCYSPQDAIDTFYGIMHEMDMKDPVSAQKQQDLKVLSGSVNPIRLRNNPVELVGDAIMELYKEILAE